MQDTMTATQTLNQHHKIIMTDINPDLLPDTTIAEEQHEINARSSHAPQDVKFSIERPGPVVNGRLTTIVCLSPEELKTTPFLESMLDQINSAYQRGHVRTGVMPASVMRLSSTTNIFQEIGSVPDTFTFLIHYTGTTEMVGTCSMWRFDHTKVLVTTGDSTEAAEKEKRTRTFHRLDPLEPHIEAWEYKMLAVAVTAQKQGLATLLMTLCAEEAKRRFAVDQAQADQNGNTQKKELLYVLTSVKEINGAWYEKQGWKTDYEHAQPIGVMGSKTGFTTIHMSKWPVA